MFIKEMVVKIYDTLLYASLHPLSSLKKNAHQTTIEFIKKKCPRAVGCRTPKRLLNISLRRIKVEGLYLEFGVFTGGSITHIAKNKKEITIHGFDSFDGLPDNWCHYDRNDFSLHGKLPKVPLNVKLHKGFFDQTLPKWTEQHKGKIAFLHIDCDLYDSTITVFKYLWDRLQIGSIIVFDDYFNFPGWEEDGHRAFHEFLQKKPIEFEYIGYSYKEIAIIVTDIKFEIISSL